MGGLPSFLAALFFISAAGESSAAVFGAFALCA